MEQAITVRSKLHMINPMWLMLQQSSMLAKFFSPFFHKCPLMTWHPLLCFIGLLSITLC